MRRLAVVLVTLTVATLTWAAGPDTPRQPLTSQLHEQEAAARAAAWQRATLAKGWVPELPPSPVDAIRYSLDLHVDLEREVISGTVEAELAATQDGLSTVALDADQGLRVLSVVQVEDESFPHDSPQELAFSHRNNRLSVTLPRSLASGERVRLLIAYGGHASTPEGGAVWTSHNSGNSPLVYTFAEPFGSRLWWPCNDRPDDKALVDVAVTAPESMVVSSNGLERGRVVNPDGTATTRWSSVYPIATYLVVMNVSDFAYSELPYTTLDGGSMPVVLYAYPELDAQAQQDLAVTPEMIGTLANAFGEYPFVEEKYGNCTTPFGGGMEHQTLTTLAASSIGTSGIDWLNVHELAHSWWGDWVTCADWKDLWLNEGFATYSELVWAEHVGPDVLAQQVEDMDWRGYFLGPVYDCPYAFSSTVYEKGALVLRMLRRLLGDPQFSAAMAAYRAAYGGSSATTADFERVVETTTGTDLDWFFQQWVYGQNRPRLRYGWSEMAGPAVRLVVRQEQTNAPLFRMPLDVRVTTVAGVVDTEVWVEAEREQTFDIPLDSAPTAVALDPDHYLLRQLATMDEPDMELGPLYPDSFDAGTVMVGSSATITVPVTNVGGSTLVLESVTRQLGEEFSLASPPSFPLEVAPGATVNLEVRFRARGAGPRDGQFAIATNDPSFGGVTTLRVKGSGLLWPDQYMVARTTSLDFGSVPVGSFAVASVTVANQGGQDLTLTASVTGDDFELLTTVPEVLPPLTEVEITVRFAPTAVGPAAGALHLTSNDPFTPTATTTLAGIGAAAPQLTLAPSALLFGSALEPVEQTLTVTNTGAEDLLVADLVTAPPFDLVDPWSLPRSMAPGESATLTVRFSPTDDGEVRGELRILSDDPASAWATVPLAGRGASATPVEQAFPAVARTAGLGGAFWSSDVVLLNPTAEDLALDLTFLPADSSTPDLSLSVPAGQQRFLADAVTALGRDGAGGLELAASGTGLVATSTTFTTDSRGTYGQGIPAQPFAAASTCAEELVVAGLAGNDGFHTNLGLLNLGATELTVDFALHAADGTLLGTRTLVAAPSAFAQATDVLTQLTTDTVRGGFAVLSCSDAAGAFLAYASVVDDGSHDPTFVAPVSAGSAPLDVVLPAVAHTAGFAGTRWRSDVTVVNTGAEDAVVTLELHPRDGGQVATASASVPAGAAAFLADVVGSTSDTIPAGWLRLTSPSGNLAVSSRTFNDDPAGTYGQEIPALRSSQLAGQGDQVVLPALVEDGQHRTNLGIASLAAADTTVRVSIRREDGTLVGDVEVTVPAGSLVQLDRVLSAQLGYSGRAWALLSCDDEGAGYTAYASVVDEGTGDPVFIPATKVVTAR